MIHVDDAAFREEFGRLCHDFRTPRLRTLREFAESEIILPDSGPYAGQRFRCRFQPFSELWFQGVDCGLFNRFVATGPSQSGKSLTTLVVPWMHTQFERRETTVVFAPEMDICQDKWETDFLPTIQRSRFADMLPKSGRGSQGGFAELITFRNGTRVKFMSAGGNDSAKASFTAKSAFGTEIEAMDDVRESSDESDPITQILARLRAHKNRRVFLECTVTKKTGRIWRELQAGTCSRIVLECVHCHEWVTPERENFVGWDGASTELEAESKGRFSCPQCGGLWSPEQRLEANQRGRLVHRGQEISTTGEVVGMMPETRTFSLRWSAVNNTFADEASLANEEWKSAKELDQETVQKGRCQQVWCVPWEGEQDATELNVDTIASRLTGLERGVVPDDVETLVVQVDLHDKWLYWSMVATSPQQVRSVIDYGIELNPNPESNGRDTAIRLGLQQLADDLEGRKLFTPDNRLMAIDHFTLDGGYREDLACSFVAERNAAARASGAQARWAITKGRGDDYKHPPKADAHTRPGSNWYFSRQPARAETRNRQWWLVIAQTNHWLRQVHNGFAAIPFLPDGVTRRPGSMAIFGNDPAIHLTPVDKSIARSTFAVQILGWRWEEIETKRHGARMQWVSYGADHWLDATYGALVADSVVRMILPRFNTELHKTSGQSNDVKKFTMPDGRPYLLTER